MPAYVIKTVGKNSIYVATCKEARNRTQLYLSASQQNQSNNTYIELEQQTEALSPSLSRAFYL